MTISTTSSQSDLHTFLKQAKLLEYFQMLKTSGNEGSLVEVKNERIRSLTLSNHRLKSLPRSILNFRGLEELYLDKCGLKEIPDELSDLPNLRLLSLKNNNLTKIPEVISNLSQLEILDLENAGDIKEIDGSLFENLNKLHKLKIGNINLSTIKGKFSIPERLNFLDLSNNSLEIVHFRSLQHSNLKILSISNNNLTKIPLGLEQIPSVQQLYLDFNRISEISKDIYHLKNLRELDVSNNNLTLLPLLSHDWSNLKIINADFNNIDQLSLRIGNIPNLEELWLGNNELDELPIQIGYLSRLKRLRINNNDLTVLPATILNLQLTELNTLQNNLPAPFNFFCPDRHSVQEFFEKIAIGIQNEESTILHSVEIREISKLHVFLETGQALLTFNGLTGKITEMDPPLAGVFQVAMNIIDTEGRSFIPIKNKDGRSIQITVYQGVGFGFDFLGLHSSLDLHQDEYLQNAVVNFVNRYGNELRDSIVDISQEDIKSSFLLYLI